VVNGVSVRLRDFNRDREVASEIEKLGYNAKGWTETKPAILRTIVLKALQIALYKDSLLS
jgi:lipoprotein-releasing system permease protein